MPIEWPVAHPTLSRDAPFLILFEGPAIHMAIPVGPKFVGEFMTLLAEHHHILS